MNKYKMNMFLETDFHICRRVELSNFHKLFYGTAETHSRRAVRQNNYVINENEQRILLKEIYS